MKGGMVAHRSKQHAGTLSPRLASHDEQARLA
jgi:hypothetical protein